MLTEKQQEWINHLSDTKIVKIKPYNPLSKTAFESRKQQLQAIVGSDTEILFKGAAAWEISGKGDIDIYIPSPAAQFDTYFHQLKDSLGEPGSFYPLERVRWNTTTNNIETEIFLVNQDADFWKESLDFWNYIESHPEALNEYRIIKENADGKSVREYYQAKIEFYNKSLNIIKQSLQ